MHIIILKFPIILSGNFSSPSILKINPWSDARYKQLNTYILLLYTKPGDQDTLIEQSQYLIVGLRIVDLNLSLATSLKIMQQPINFEDTIDSKFFIF